MSDLITNNTLPPGEEPPKIEFPCDYPIKVMGEAADDFLEVVLREVKRFVPELDESKIKVRDSAKGNFTSITLVIYATGKEQLHNIHVALKATGRVKMVL